MPSGGLTAEGYCLVLRRWPTPKSQNIIGSVLFIVEFFLPIALYAFCYSRLYFRLKIKVSSSQPGQADNAQSGNAGSDRNARARRNVLKTMIIVCLCFVLCWIWNQMYYFLSNLGIIERTFRGSFSTFSTFCIYINCCINPFIYIFHYDQFRKGIGILKKRIVGNDPSTTTTDVSDNST